MYKIPSRKPYYILLISFIVFSILFFYYKDLYKEFIIEKIYTSINFKIEFKESSLSFFPSPGIQLSDVRINNIEEYNKYNAEINKMGFYFSWKILIGIIELNSIHIKSGKLELSPLLKEPNLNSKNSMDPKYIQKLIGYLKLDLIVLDSIEFTLNKNETRYEFYIKYLAITNDHLREVGLAFDISHNNGRFISDTKVLFINSDYSFQSLQIESKIKFSNFILKPFKDYYSLVRGANFDNTSLSGQLNIYKPLLKNEFNFKTDINISGLQFSGAPIYPIIGVSSELMYSIENQQIYFSNIRVNYEKGAIANASGNLSFTKDIYLNLNINGEYADIYKVVYIIVRSLDIRISSNLNFYSHMKINCYKAVFDLYEFKNANLDLDIINSLVKIKVNHADTIHGHISGDGSIQASSNTSYNFNVILKDINTEEWIKKYTTNPYIKGALSANLSLTSNGNNLENFLENLSAKGKLEVKKGELLGYANILKPVFSLGKLVNILGPRGKNTEFQSLICDFSIYRKNISVQNLKMVGVGIDAHGSGNITLDRKIDFRIYAGLGGIAGKALHIPIIYKGIMPDNVSYIDPVWIGSVYVGATLFGGPAGATVGGFAGSAVSEYVNKAWDGLKKIFSRD